LAKLAKKQMNAVGTKVLLILINENFNNQVVKTGGCMYENHPI
jgi:hypothetical protein